MSSEFGNQDPSDPAVRLLKDASISQIRQLGDIFEGNEERINAVVEAEVRARATELGNAAAAMALAKYDSEEYDSAAQVFIRHIERLDLKDALVEHLSATVDRQYVNFLREEAGITNAELARHFGVSPAQVSRVFSGERRSPVFLRQAFIYIKIKHAELNRNLPGNKS